MIPQFIADIAARLTAVESDDMYADIEFGISALKTLSSIAESGKDVDWTRLMVRFSLAIASQAQRTEKMDRFIALMGLYLEGEPVGAALADPELTVASTPASIDIVRADFLRLLDELTTPHITEQK